MKRLIIYAWATLLCCAAYAQVPNVTGRVTSTGGLPIEGVVVSDGFNCTQTDADGRYALTSDLELRRFVFVSVPAEYEIPARHGCPQFFRRIDRFQKEVKADFVLEPRLVPAVHHTLLVQGDPQIKNYGVDGSAEAYRSVVIPDIRMRSTITTPCYGINLGDLVYNDMNVYNAYIDNTGRVNTTTFNVIGNHDHDQTTILSDSLGTVYFEMYLGPTCYSVELGELHFIFLDNIVMKNNTLDPNNVGAYSDGLSDEAYSWLCNDLKYVDKDRTVMLCAHSSMFRKPDSEPADRDRHGPDYASRLAQYRCVHSWAGHSSISTTPIRPRSRRRSFPTSNRTSWPVRPGRCGSTKACRATERRGAIWSWRSTGRRSVGTISLILMKMTYLRGWIAVTRSVFTLPVSGTATDTSTPMSGTTTPAGGPSAIRTAAKAAPK